MSTFSLRNMQPGHFSSLLPDPFKHSSSQVRVFRPQIVLSDFHGTISERRWEDKVIFPYVRSSMVEYLNANWQHDIVQKCIPGLRNESFEQSFRHKYDDAPIIDEIINDTSAQDELDPKRLASQLGEFLLWQMNTKRETRETQLIQRLVWIDGFNQGKIKLPVYDDVASSIKKWRDKHHCQLFVISSLDTTTLKLFFEHTNQGNLDDYVNGYVSSSKPGDKLISEIYRLFHEKHISNNKQQVAATAAASPPKSPLSSQPSTTTLPKPILFLTDSGQEAKAASQVSSGLAYECLLVNRPSNKRIRSYYLSQFQYIDKFTDIEFV